MHNNIIGIAYED